MKANPSLPLNMSSAMKRPRVHSSPPQPAYHNGHHSQRPGACEGTGSQERLSGEEEEQGESGQDEDEEEEDEGEMEVAEAPRRWSGIEAIFEAYQEYTEGELSSVGVAAFNVGMFSPSCSDMLVDVHYRMFSHRRRNVPPRVN